MKPCLYFLSLLLIWNTSFGCKKLIIDRPPDTTNYDPKLHVTHSIRELKEFYKDQAIIEDITIEGIIIMDDREGNIYKKLIIADATGGIEMLLDQTQLFNDYPVGRKVYIHCRNLWLSHYNDLPQLGGVPDQNNTVSNIPFNKIKGHIVKANYPNVIIPDTLTLHQLTDPNQAKEFLNRLIYIENIEFESAILGLPLASSPTNASATNRKIKECTSEATLDIRTSGFARFQSFIIPEYNGGIHAIYSRFGNTPQLLLRSTDDILLDQTRCDSTAYSTPNVISIDSLRRKYQGNPLHINGFSISGTIISDKNHGNILPQNCIIQQENRGIMIRFKTNHHFNLGDSILININGATLEEYNGLLQVNNLSNAYANKLGLGIIEPMITNLSDFQMNFEFLESTLIQINNVSFAGTGILSGNKTINDGTSSAIVFTRSDASFANSSIPLNPTNIIGIAGQFGTTKQIQLRNINDIFD